MGSWNYRVVKKDGQLKIHGVYYDAQEMIIGIDSEADFPYGDELEDLEERLELMIESLRKPVIDFETLKEI